MPEPFQPELKASLKSLIGAPSPPPTLTEQTPARADGAATTTSRATRARSRPPRFPRIASSLERVPRATPPVVTGLARVATTLHRGHRCRKPQFSAARGSRPEPAPPQTRRPAPVRSRPRELPWMAELRLDAGITWRSEPGR